MQIHRPNENFGVGGDSGSPMFPGSVAWGPLSFLTAHLDINGEETGIYDGVFVPMWPRGHRSDSNDGGLSIFDSQGEVVASTGSIIRIGGYIRVEKPVVPGEMLSVVSSPRSWSAMT